MSHAKYPEFVKIQALNFCNCSQEDIAEYVGVSQPTVSRILVKLQSGLSPEEIEKSRREHRTIANQHVHQRIDPWWDLERYVLYRLREHQDSPDQMAGRWKEERWEKLSKDTIYAYIRNHHPHLIKKYFRRKGKQYRNRKQDKAFEKYQLMDRRMIDDRPVCIERRRQIWHWEWDTIIGKRWVGKQVIATNVERKSWYLLSRVCEDKGGEQMYLKTVEMFKSIPQNKKKTNTYDNGREFAQHRNIEWKTGITIYFAHPYHSWERWTNENTNGLLRQYYPKWTSFTCVKEHELQEVVKKLNWRPRKRLNYKTPEEVFWGKRKALTKICNLN